MFGSSIDKGMVLKIGSCRKVEIQLNRYYSAKEFVQAALEQLRVPAMPSRKRDGLEVACGETFAALLRSKSGSVLSSAQESSSSGELPRLCVQVLPGREKGSVRKITGGLALAVASISNIALMLGFPAFSQSV